MEATSVDGGLRTGVQSPELSCACVSVHVRGCADVCVCVRVCVCVCLWSLFTNNTKALLVLKLPPPISQLSELCDCPPILLMRTLRLRGLRGTSRVPQAENRASWDTCVRKSRLEAAEVTAGRAAEAGAGHSVLRPLLPPSVSLVPPGWSWPSHQPHLPHGTPLHPPTRLPFKPFQGDPPFPHPGPLGFRKSTSKPTKAEG